MERWARFHSREPGRALVAIYRPNRLLRGRLLTYNRRADATLRLFDEEADARAWLSREIHA